MKAFVYNINEDVRHALQSSHLTACSTCLAMKPLTYATLTVMHDATFSDHMRVSMWKFMNSGTENALYGIRINGL